MYTSNHALITSAVSLSGGEGVFLHCCKANERVVAADNTFNVDGCEFRSSKNKEKVKEFEPIKHILSELVSSSIIISL